MNIYNDFIRIHSQWKFSDSLYWVSSNSESCDSGSQQWIMGGCLSSSPYHLHNSGSSVAAWVLLHIIFTLGQAVRAAAILGTAGCRGSKEWVAKHMTTFQVSFYLSKILQPNQLTWPNLTSRRRKTTLIPWREVHCQMVLQNKFTNLHFHHKICKRWFPFNFVFKGGIYFIIIYWLSDV